MGKKSNSFKYMDAFSKPLNFYSEDFCLSNTFWSSLADKTEVFAVNEGPVR